MSKSGGKESSSYICACWWTCTRKHGPHRLFHMKALRSSDFCPRLSLKLPLGIFYVNESLFLYLHSSFHLSWSTTEHLFKVLGLFVFWGRFFVISYHFVPSPTKRAVAQRFSPPASSSLSSFARGMADDCALGDLLLDPTSVRCRD